MRSNISGERWIGTPNTSNRDSGCELMICPAIIATRLRFAAGRSSGGIGALAGTYTTPSSIRRLRFTDPTNRTLSFELVRASGQGFPILLDTCPGIQIPRSQHPKSATTAIMLDLKALAGMGIGCLNTWTFRRTSTGGGPHINGSSGGRTSCSRCSEQSDSPLLRHSLTSWMNVRSKFGDTDSLSALIGTVSSGTCS